MTLDKIIMSFMTGLEKDKRLYHDKNFMNIPDIIDTKTDKKIWDAMYNIMYIYMDLVQEFVFEEKDFELFLEDWVDYFSIVRKECDDASKVMLISIYIHAQYETLLNWCVQNEYYEGASNLKRFNELL